MPYVELAPTESQVQTVLRSFLLGILPAGVEVIQGQDNRVPEPVGTDFVVMTPTLRNRLMTNVDGYQDNLFTASIAGAVLTVTEVIAGELHVGGPIFGAGVAQGTYIVSEGTGSGGTGTYTVNTAQIVPSGVISSSTSTFLNQTQLTIQLDVHGPNGAENSQLIGTLFRDDFAAEIFKTSGLSVCPLYADDPKQIPFVNGENQVEPRWVVDCVLQVNQTTLVSAGQQFFTEAEVTTGHVPA